ncbi:hypothetical protein OIDMADRAFT_32191 [Oidiodendron maius Zn]|uniref:Uncharacterized protein n=1 Tax=Oidiodendron maius (strain Zn) TaxID=913774 RepID=A0A0C3GM28_OIDMZ|nr:hypothetical protein OIDMADRAFT_32191 [Oidiodendron maius Zn]
MSLSFSGQSPRLIDLWFPGSELNAWPWSAGILPMSMPTPVMSTSPMVDSQLLPQMKMAHHSVLDDDVEEIIREPRMLDVEMWTPLDQHISSSSTAPPTLAKHTPVDKIYRQPEFLKERLRMLRRLFSKRTREILSMNGATKYPCATALWPLFRDLENIERDLDTIERDSETLSHAVTSIDNLQKKPAFRDAESEHLRRRVMSLATESEYIRTAITLGSTLVLAFSESSDQHLSTIIEHLRAVSFLANRALLSYKENSKDDTFPRFRFLCDTWLHMAIIAQLVLVDDDDSTGFEIDLASLIIQFSTRIVGINPLMAYAFTLFPIIGRVAIFCRKVRKVESNSIAIISQATELKEAIVQWSPPPVIEQSEDPSSKISNALRTAEAYRHTALLYLYQAVPEIAS